MFDATVDRLVDGAAHLQFFRMQLALSRQHAWWQQVDDEREREQRAAGTRTGDREAGPAP
ncbi:MAG TPA: hypothetical protein EYP98_20940 [Planctomycetes bacterium]|nr:hypothetical protein [Planctomycetota bacterium]